MPLVFVPTGEFRPPKKDDLALVGFEVLRVSQDQPEEVRRRIYTAIEADVPALIAGNAKLREACEALLVMMDHGDKPMKLDAALTWRENDEKARDMAFAALASTKMEAP